MLEPREYEGFWWLPRDPDRKVPGTLTYSQTEIRLELLGSLVDMPTSGPAGHLDDQPRILGLTKDRKTITLERNLGLGQSFNSPGFPVSKYGPHTVLVGAWYEPDEEVRFDRVVVRYSDLDTWAVASGFSQSFETSPDGMSLTKLQIGYEPPERIDVALDEETTLSIAWSWSWSGFKHTMTDVRVDQSAQLGVVFREPATLSRCLEYVFQLRNFLSLAVGRPIRVLSVHGFRNLPPEEHPPNAIDVEVLYQLIGIPKEPARDLFHDEMLFSLADARPRLQEIVQAWFARQAILGPVFNRYFYILHNEHMAREIQFESYVRALETYHRRSTPTTALPVAEHAARLDEILSGTPAAHRDWLEQELHYSNEPDLKQRLTEILDRCPAVVGRLVGTTRKQQRAFVRKVVVTRNYEIHLDPENEREAAASLSLVTLVFQLRALVEMVLLLDLGLACVEVDGIFGRARRYELVDHIRAHRDART